VVKNRGMVFFLGGGVRKELNGKKYLKSFFPDTRLTSLLYYLALLPPHFLRGPPRVPNALPQISITQVTFN